MEDRSTELLHFGDASHGWESQYSRRSHYLPPEVGRSGGRDPSPRPPPRFSGSWDPSLSVPVPTLKAAKDRILWRLPSAPPETHGCQGFYGAYPQPHPKPMVRISTLHRTRRRRLLFQGGAAAHRPTPTGVAQHRQACLGISDGTPARPCCCYICYMCFIDHEEVITFRISCDLSNVELLTWTWEVLLATSPITPPSFRCQPTIRPAASGNPNNLLLPEDLVALV